MKRILFILFLGLTLPTQLCASQLLFVDEAERLLPTFFIDLEMDNVTDAEGMISMHAVVEGKATATPMLVHFGLSNYKGISAISMQPRYPLNPKLEYLIRIADQSESYRVPAVASELESPNVSNVYPASNEISANLLTLYIEFDKPMKADHKAYHCVSLIRENGEEIAEVWRSSRSLAEKQYGSFVDDTSRTN